MTQGEFKDNESIPSKRYYVLTEDVPCWHWSKNEDGTLDWSIIGYNSKEVSPRKIIPEEYIQKDSDDYAVEFYLWMKKNETKIARGKHITDQQLLEIFKKEKGL